MIAYKVLKGGQSCHGGRLTWSLPTSIPGEWHEVNGVLSLCQRGLHVTTEPGRWWVDGCEVFLAEYEGVQAPADDRERELAESKAKILARRVRLIRRVEMIEIEKGKWKVRQDESRSSGWADPERV